jgi:stearoyl-CoA desaturase (delta-9 desaturase)
VQIFSEATAWTALSFVGWFLVFYLYHGLGTTLGYHRLLTHKSLKVPRWLMYFIVSGGYLGLMGAPIVWVAVHRLHHQKSDLNGDPHSPNDGFMHALVGWMFHMKELQPQDELERQVPDLLDDPVLKIFGTDHEPRQAMICLGSCILFRVLILAFLGPVAFAANLLASVMTFWSTQLVNAVCHLKTAGYRSHETREESRNVWWVGVLALGEGWHNNHHALPKSARHGINWWEFDVTWYSIWLMEKLGLAKLVIRPNKLTVAAVQGSTKDLPELLRPLDMSDHVAEPVYVKKSRS